MHGDRVYCFFHCAMVWCRTFDEDQLVCEKGFHVKKAELKKNVGLSRRLHFPEDEKRLVWLHMLLDAYAIVDTGIAVAIRDEEKKHKKKLACGKGCGNCCVHQKDLPLYPHELVGIYWYVSEKMTSPERDILRERLENHTPGMDCPFLMDGACAPGEDPYYTRRNDVLEPIADYTDRAFAAVIPFYNLKKEGDLSATIRLIRGQIMNIQTFDWKKLVSIMGNADLRRSK
jgi:hypothetical protein